MRVFFYSFILFLLSITLVQSQVPPGYYQPAAGLSGQPLLIALHGIIDNHTPVDYNSLYTYMQQTDKKPDNTVWDMYSDIPGGTPPYVYYYIGSDECGNYSGEGDCFNREHSWPKSWFGGEVMPMYSDLFHLYPTDGYVNNMRNNYPYGTVASPQWTSENGSKLGNCSWPGYSDIVFEPIDAFKGDFARTYFYMSTRYYGQDGSWPGSDMTNGAQLKPWARAMMLQWSAQDPVSPKETARNNAIYLVQGNRNPFIDNPQYAIDIWGPGAGIGENYPLNISLTVYPNPAHEVCTLSIPAVLVSSDVTFCVYSVTGTPVFSEERTAANTMALDLKSLSPGLYFIRLVKDGNALPYTGRIVLQ